MRPPSPTPFTPLSHPTLSSHSFHPNLLTHAFTHIPRPTTSLQSLLNLFATLFHLTLSLYFYKITLSFHSFRPTFLTPYSRFFCHTLVLSHFLTPLFHPILLTNHLVPHSPTLSPHSFCLTLLSNSFATHQSFHPTFSILPPNSFIQLSGPIRLLSPFFNPLSYPTISPFFLISLLYPTLQSFSLTSFFNPTLLFNSLAKLFPLIFRPTPFTFYLAHFIPLCHPTHLSNSFQHTLSSDSSYPTLSP